MEKNRQVKILVRVGVITAFATLAFVGTTVIRIPIPATGGYFNLGDTFVMIGALLYGPIVGFFVGMVGPTVADAIGFPQFMLATLIVKAIEGLSVGLVGSTFNVDRSYAKTIIALAIGTAIIVCGYFIFEAFIYPLLATVFPFFGVTDKNAAIAELLPNALQGLFSSIIAIGIWRVLKPKTSV